MSSSSSGGTGNLTVGGPSSTQPSAQYPEVDIVDGDPSTQLVTFDLVLDGRILDEVKNVSKDHTLAKFRDHEVFAACVGQRDVEFIRRNKPVSRDSETRFCIGDVLRGTHELEVNMQTLAPPPQQFPPVRVSHTKIGSSSSSSSSSSFHVITLQFMQKNDLLEEFFLWLLPIENHKTVQALKEALRIDMNLFYLPSLWKGDTELEDAWVIATHLFDKDILGYM